MTPDRRRPSDGRPPETRRTIDQQLHWMIAIRLVVVTSVVLPYFLLRITSPVADGGADFLYLLAGLTYAASLLYIVLLRVMKGRAEAQVYVQFFGDLLIITGMVYYFGGVASPFSILYFVVVIVASTLLRRKGSYVVAAMAWLLYAGAVIGVHLDWLPSPTTLTTTQTESLEGADVLTAPRQPDEIPTGRLLYYLGTHLFGFFTVAFLISHLVRDISLAEQELEAQREDLADLQLVHQDVIESIPSGLITCDPEGIVTSANSAAREILDLSSAEPLGRPLADSGLFTGAEWRSLTGDEAPTTRRREVVYDRNGSERTIGYSVTTLRSASGEATGHILIFQDLSDWRKLQEEVRLKDRMVAVGEMASGIAHEVGNPLAAITGSVQMLSSSFEGGDSQSKLLSIILKESQRLDRTVKGFLSFARPKDRSNVRFDIAKLLSENLELLRNSSEVSAGHRLEIELEPKSVNLVADPDQMSQIFWNLTRNALRAMPDGGTLRIRGTLDGDSYRVRFIDTGRGMGTQERDKLFHPFHSFFDEGSGIGMAIVYRIVEEHGGRLSVESEPGVGTAITVVLPLAYTRGAAAPTEIPA